MQSGVAGLNGAPGVIKCNSFFYDINCYQNCFNNYFFIDIKIPHELLIHVHLTEAWLIILGGDDVRGLQAQA